MKYQIHVEFKNDDVFVAQEEDAEVGNTLFAHGLYFEPLAIFREHIESSVPIETDLDPHEYRKLHLVTVHWFEFFGENDDNPLYKSTIAGVYPTRRQAVKSKFEIELGEIGGEWSEGSTIIEEVVVYSLDVED
jgi:hypothetical protein